MSQTVHIIQANQDYRNNIQAVGAVQDDAVKHYDECYRDYLFAWCNLDNLALHYGYWDEKSAYHQHQALLNKNKILYQTAGIQSHHKVLDAGCGIGGSSIWMAKTHGNHLTGISISQQQITNAQKHAQRHGVANLVNFQVADFCHTPFADASFDVVWALESSCHALNKADFLQEAYRLLTPGGRLVVCDGFLLQREFDDQQWQAVQTCLNGWAVPNLCDRQEFKQLLVQQQFQHLQIFDITPQTMPSVRHMYKVAKRLLPVQKISQFLGLRSPAQTANFWVGIAQYQLFSQKLTEYCIFTARKP